MFDLDIRIFRSVFVISLVLVLLGWGFSIAVYGELTRVDLVGSLIALPIFAYLVHLWILYSKRDS